MIFSFIKITLEPSPPRYPCVIEVSRDGIQLNWIPPLQPNGDVHYVIEYFKGNHHISVNTNRSTFFNLTGLQNGVTYNITVVAVNKAGKSDTGAVLGYRHKHESPG